jgi:hypothetical protein
MTPKPKYIVSDDYRFVYFVVQKVACTSIKSALLPLFDIYTTGHKMSHQDNDPGYRVHKLFNRSGHQIDETEFVAELDEQYRDYFKFAFVRNPWDRLVSCYFNKFAHNNAPGLKIHGRVDVELYPGMPFAEFVEAVHKIPDSKANPHFRSQHKVICAWKGVRPIMANFVGRFENLQDDFAIVAEKIGAPELRLPHRQRSEHRESRSYTEFYDDRLKDLVHERYQEDIEIFGYSFGDPHGLPPLWRQDDRASSRRPKQDVETQHLKRDAEIRRLRRDAERLSKKNQRLRKRNRNLKRQLQNVRSSKSWRLLNKISKLGKRLSRHFGRK